MNKFDEILTRLIAVLIVTAGIGAIIWFVVVALLAFQRAALS
jgi:hypothetical protein